MKVKQINLRKSFVATNLFASQLDTLTVGLLSEPYHYRNKISRLGYNFDLFPDTTLLAPPRAAILVPKSFNATFLPHLSTPDVAVVFFKQFNLLLVSGYCDIKLPMIQDWLTNIMNYVNSRNCKVVFGLDSNAHSELYGRETDSRGETLESFIFLHSLDVENRGDIPTFSTIRRGGLATSFIDITLSRDIQVVDWWVDQSFNNSDHNTLSFEILTGPNPPKMIRAWKHANWTRFTRILQTKHFPLPTIMSTKKLDRLVTKLYKILNYALDKACPLRPAKSGEQNIKWWNSSLNKEAKKVGKQYRITKRCKSLSEIIKLKNMKQKFKRMCKKEKRNSWRKFTLHLKETNRMASLAKTLQQKERQKLYTLKNPDGSMTEPGQETLNLLFQTHFPAATPLRKVTYRAEPDADILSLSSLIEQKYDSWINITTLDRAFSKFNKKKSPGPDGDKPIVFDHLPSNCKKIILFLYKSCVHFHYTPALWKDTKVIFIPKPGKDDYSLPKSFRPISLSNYFLKALERLACWRMDESLLMYPLHNRQHGFMPGRSTESAISVTTNYIEKYLAHKEHCLGVFLDISAAFDSIDIDHVRRALLQHGGDPDMVDWYHNYLSHRNLFAELHGEVASCSTGVGFPQGGVCSARFWLIAFNQAIKIINTTFVEGVGYADDCCILMGGTDQSHMVAQVQRVVNKLITWGSTCGLRFNHSKTVVILFTRSKKVFRQHIRIDGNSIPYSQHTKYLGLTLDSRLNWTLHIQSKAKACKRFLFMVAKITKDSYGPSPKIMRWTYLCVVRPMMTYGALCWAHMIHAGKNDSILRNLNRAGMNLYCNFPRSTPTRTVEIITDTIPLDLQAQKVGLGSRIRMQNLIHQGWDDPFPQPNSNKTVSHVQHWDQLIADCNLEEFLVPDDTVSFNLPFTNYNIVTDSFSGHSKFLIPSQVNVFTDGSKLNDKVGAGVYISCGNYEIKKSYRLPDKASVFQAEIFAINQAAIILQNHLLKKYIKFFVDSQAALLALNKKFITSRLVGDTVHNLNLIPGIVRLVWIKAHVGHDGNEIADALAKEGTTLTAFYHIPLPRQATKRAIQLSVDEYWHFQWSRYNDGRQSKQFYPAPNRTKAKYCYNLSRKELGRLIRIVTGHNNLFYHRSNVDKSGDTSASCRFCGEERETFFHFATNCPCFRLSRFQYFNNDSCFSQGKWSVRRILDFSNIPSITAALGGNFDPFTHLEQQCDLEDLIEGEQENADLQPGRQHNPQQPHHQISSSDSDPENEQSSTARDLIVAADLVHALSSSESSSVDNDCFFSNDTSDPDDPGEPDAASTIVVNVNSPNAPEKTFLSSSNNDTGQPEAGSTVTDFHGFQSPPKDPPMLINYQRTTLNFDNYELTDDDYLQNETSDEDL